METPFGCVIVIVIVNLTGSGLEFTSRLGEWVVCSMIGRLLSSGVSGAVAARSDESLEPRESVGTQGHKRPF